MTRVFETALRNAGRFALPLIGGIMILGLAGCGSQTASVDADPALTAPQVQPTKPIAFAPIIGAPAKVSSKLNELLVAAAGQKSMPVVPSKEADYTIRGYLVAAADPKGTKLSYIWDITDKGGKRAKRFQGDELVEGKKGGDAWGIVDEAALQRVAAKTTDELLAWLPKAGNTAGTTTSTAGSTQPTSATGTTPPAEQPATTQATEQPAAKPQPKAAAAKTGPVLAAQTQQPAASGPIVAVVEPVTGAPGDGVTSLTAAMKRHLRENGVTLADNAGANSYVVRGSVEVDQASDGQQPITIRWRVVRPDGKNLDKAIIQRNKVPEGSLDGQWGQVADLAANEAAKSVAKLIKPMG